MSLNRRDLFKLGGLSVLGAAGLAVPLGGGASTKSISTLSGTQFPKRYATAFIRPPVLDARCPSGAKSISGERGVGCGVT